jgi:outer membrane protein OmpU
MRGESKSFYKPEGKDMKNVLLATTALVATAGIAAAEITTTATGELSYGNWDGASNDWSASAGVNFALSGEASGIAYSASVDVDTDSVSIGAISMSSNGVTFTYYPDADNEGDTANEEGEVRVDYANGGIAAYFESEADTSVYAVGASYTSGDLTLGVDYDDNAGATSTTVSASYVMGNVTLSAEASDDAWEVGGDYAMGDTTVGVTADSDEVYGISVDTTLNGLSLGASYNTDEETTLSVGYTMGDLGVALAYDSTNAGGVGDDAETILTVTYDLGDLDFTFEANDQEEMQATAAFTF